MAPQHKKFGRLGAARYARQLIKSARRAAKKLTARDDAEALHRFRIRVRKLRAFLKTYAKYLGSKRLNRSISRLGQLIDTTNTSRDLQVQLRWLDLARIRKRLSPRARESARWMIKHLTANAVGPNIVDPVRLTKALNAAVKKTDAQLDTWLSKAKGTDPAKADKVFNRLAARNIHRTADKLEQSLANINGPDDHNAAHRTRLITKRLRYNLEQMCKTVAAAAPAAIHLKRLQDLLGELRDRQVLELQIARCLADEAAAWARELIEHTRSIPDPADGTNSTGHQAICLGLRDLIAELRHEQSVLHRRLDRVWLQDHGQSNLRMTRMAADALLDLSKREHSKQSSQPVHS